MQLRDLIDRLLGRPEKNSRSVARDSLQLVLMQDRSALPASTMELIRKEILQVLAKHIDISTLKAVDRLALVRANELLATTISICAALLSDKGRAETFSKAAVWYEDIFATERERFEHPDIQVH